MRFSALAPAAPIIARTLTMKRLCGFGLAILITVPSLSPQIAHLTSFKERRRSAPPQNALSLPIFYDQELKAKGFPSPLIRVRIAGHEALFIVDSGTGVNTLADWFAEQA